MEKTGMICLTGDIHQNIKSINQSILGESESRSGIKYLSIARKNGIKVTFFITGKAFEDDWNDLRELTKFNNLEIGGHTWNAFKPKWTHIAFKYFVGSYYGPSFVQQRDIKKTLSIIEKKTKTKVISWRTHGYNSDHVTKKKLKQNGIKIISDTVNFNIIRPCIDKEIINLPINILPDHEHLYHGKRDRKLVKEYIKKGTKYHGTNKSYYIKGYFKVIKKQIMQILNKNGIAIVLLHPECMKVADNFGEFEKFCQWINNNKIETIWCKEIPQTISNNG